MEDGRDGLSEEVEHCVEMVNANVMQTYEVKATVIYRCTLPIQMLHFFIVAERDTDMVDNMHMHIVHNDSAKRLHEAWTS